MATLSQTPAPRPWRYDRELRRLWIANQRIHHGMTGALLAATGALLMLHDRRDHSLWFQRGPQRQP